MVSRAKFAALSLASTALLGACGGGDGGSGQNQAIFMLPAEYTKVWEDEFNDGVALNPTYWDYDLGAPLLGGTVWGNSERQFYTSDSANIRIENGNLLIQPLATLPLEAPSRSPTLLASSARVKTDTPGFYTALGNSPYGFYEIRAQVPCVAGAWSAIWMLGTGSTEWPLRGELDLMEWFQNIAVNGNVNYAMSSIHTSDDYWDGLGGRSISDKQPVAGLCNEFKKYQLHWQETKISFYVDGTLILEYQRPTPYTPQNWPFDQPAYLILNVAVGGTLGGNVNTNDIARMGMRVDYVRIWQPPR